MTKYLGDGFLLQIEDPDNPGEFLTLANCRSNSKTLNNELIDVTDKDGMPWRELLEGGVQSIELSAAGIFTNADTQRTVRIWAQTNVIKNYRMIDLMGNSATCGFQIQSFEEQGEYNKEQTFTCKLASSGTPTFVNAASA
jgi:TP901-1 family phage major tail protein